MKVLLLSESDINGGAARGTHRLHRGLRAAGIDSSMLVRDRYSSDTHVIQRSTPLTKLGPVLNRQAMRIVPKPGRDAHFSAQWVPDNLLSRIQQYNPDLIHLQWVCNGFMQVETVGRLHRPIVWTLMDMWTLTGGCHYSGECDRYTQSCGDCPQLHTRREADLSRWIWRRKQRSWRDQNLTLVAPSQWMADCAKASSLFQDARVEVIPLGLNVKHYTPVHKSWARELLGLPQDKQIVLFGAIDATRDKRKGFQLLLPALQQLAQNGWSDQIELAIFGASEPQEPIDLGFKAHYLDKLRDDLTLAIVYSAADVMVVPSLQESFGQTASEAFACGTPVVAFDATGLKDIVTHQHNGYLAKPYEVDDLAQGIAWVLQDADRHQKLGHAARKKAVDAFAIEVVTQQHIHLFNEILGNRTERSTPVKTMSQLL